MSTQQDEEIDRIFKLLDDGLETQIFKKTRLTGVDVHSSLLSVIERRTSSSPSSSAVKQDDSIARMLYEDDPFAIAPASFSSVDRSSSNSSRVIVNDKLSSAQQLADALAKQDPFNIVEALSDVNNQFIGPSSNSTRQPSAILPVNIHSCDDNCQGCINCDGMEYIHHIKDEQNLDDYEQAVEEEDGGQLFETNDGLAIDTDDEHVEVNKDFYMDDEEEYQNPEVGKSGPSWNSNNMSFWEMHEEGKTLLVKKLQQQKHFNSACTRCFTPTNCQPCEVNLKNPSAKKSASYIKEFAMRTTVMELGNLPCSRTCKFGKDCLRKLSVGQIYELRKRFFGGVLEEAPKDKERKERAVSILTECYDAFKKTFSYRILRMNGIDYNEVCEGAFLVALGKLGNMKTNQISKSWVDAKRIVMGTKYDDSIKIRPAKDFKLQHAGGYIDFITNLFVHQDPLTGFAAMQTIGETSPLAGYGKCIVLPYDNLKQLHREYVVHSFSRGFAAQFIAGYTTFRTAFFQREHLRFLGAKGSFNTCEICNSLNNLLKNTHNKLKKKEQIRVVQEFKRLHIAQQSIERKALEVRKQMALEVDDSGQPMQALLFFDGMTELTGNTPKIGGVRTSKVDHVIANRVIGVEVYCGPINTVFLYNTDQMVGKGANTMVEVVRQAMSDLALELKKINLVMPQKISWQFDNCGENKNKTMFAYASALIELGYFEGIDINFLIVGHTHSSIDQYFSVLSKSIKTAEFVGSPISLQALCSQAHRDRCRPAVNRQINVCYNWVDALKPYINKKIKFFQVPHCFSFRRRGNKCIMFYKLFSSHDKWLPTEPDLSAVLSANKSSASPPADEHHEKLIEALATESNHITAIEIRSLSCFDGKKAFMNHIGISGDNKSNYLINNKQARNKIDAVDSVLPIIAEEEIISLHNLEQRTEAEEKEGHAFEHLELIKEDISASERVIIQNAMKSVSSTVSKKGYIMWIIDSIDLPPLDTVVPKLIHTGASIHLTPSQQSEYARLKASLSTNSSITSNLYDPMHIEVPTNEDDDDEANAPVVVSTEENQFERTKKSFQQRAKDIVAVSKKALEHINSTKGGITLNYSFFADKFEFDARCWEDRCYIAPEKVYFEQRQSIPHYKLYLESIALEALKTPCKFFLTQNIDEATLQKYQMELQAAKDSAKAMRIYLTKLQKTGLAVQPGTEVVARDGYSMTTAQLEDLQALVNEDRNSSRRAPASTNGRGRGKGRGRQSNPPPPPSNNSQSQPSQNSELQTTVTRPEVEGTRNAGRGSNRSKTSNSSRGNNRNRATELSIIEGNNSTDYLDTKRKRCGIELCEGYCDDTTLALVCEECIADNSQLRFCSMHVPHISHSGQLGFIERPDNNNSTGTEVISSKTALKSVDEELKASSSNSGASTSSTVLVARPLSPITLTISAEISDTTGDTNSNPVVRIVPSACILLSTASALGTSTDNYNAQQKKVIRLFSEGFQQSKNSNISAKLKIFGALDHSCYKDSLGIIASHYCFQTVTIPSVSELGKKELRTKYLNDVIQEYTKQFLPNDS